MQPEDVINHYEEKISGVTAQDVLRDEVPTMGRIANAASVKKLMPQIQHCYAYVRDCVSGRCVDYSKTTLRLIVGGLAYLALPNDIVPDFIPTVGLLDDVIVLEWILRQVSVEINHHRTKAERPLQVKNESV